MSDYAFVFPGQGAQYSGMGRELADEFEECRNVFDEADRALGRPIAELCFSGTDEALALTENTQPAILTVSVAACRALLARGLRPAATAGHSLGEYSAHVAAGTLRFDDAVRTVEARGRFMQQSVRPGQGAMAAIVGLSPDEVGRVCEAAAQGQVLAPANFNEPNQTVIAGHAEAVERGVEQALAAGARRAVPLAVSAPFHCALMKPAAERLRSAFAEIAWRDPAVPVYANVDARPVSTAEQARSALVRQVASPVRWSQLVASMRDAGVETFVEIGPGRVLSGLIRRIDRGARVLHVADPEGVRQAVAELGVAA